ncbi:MAG: LexA family transcriptional regulator [Bacteroidota bacterium]|nr:LexA family transcriptional regulator [Bacteroidota bacterium]MDP4204745.1 LexA family transcriptional regulator [Bacteroidota bacterium]
MNFLASNIRFLRKDRGVTQDELAKMIGVNRSMIGSYEEGRAVPRISGLQALSVYFKVGIDDLINHDLSNEIPGMLDVQGKGLRVLSTIVDSQNRELITLVGVKASAGYLHGYADPEYMNSLPCFSLPVPELSKERTYRAFQIKGDSMLPIPSGAYVFCEYLQNWNEMRDGQSYILMTRDDGVVFKRVYHQSRQGEFLLKSDNPEYDPYTLSVDKVFEVWKALGYLSFNLPKPDDVNMHKLSSMVLMMRKELDEIKNKK